MAIQYGGSQKVTTKNLFPAKHPLDFAVDPRMYAAQDMVLDSYPNRQINYIPGTGGQVPGVIHAHGLVAKVENDGVPAFTLTGNAGVPGASFAEYTIDMPDVSNPPALLLYHDHAYGFTRLNVYAGAAGAFLVSAGVTILQELQESCLGPARPGGLCSGLS